jgi:hypothetical protein
MKKLWLLGMAGLLLFAGCAGTTAVTTGSFPTTTSITSTPTVTVPGEPVAVNYVRGPYEPINPGGPTIEIALKNVSSQPIVSLAASLGVNSSPPGRDFEFTFDVSPETPLAPNVTISAKMTLIGGGFGSDVTYPLTVSGAFQDGSSFSFTESVQIAPPPG